MNKSIFTALIGFSTIWVAVATFLYFDNLVHYPKSYVEYFKLEPIYDCFGYEDDVERKEDALAYAKSHGHGAEAEIYLNMGLRFVKPVFSWGGYLKLLFFPLLVIWLLGFIL